MFKVDKQGYYILDVKGYTCPYPQFLVLKALEKLSQGEKLEVILDNPPSYKLVQEIVKNRGHKVILAEQIRENLWRIIIEK